LDTVSYFRRVFIRFINLYEAFTQSSMKQYKLLNNVFGWLAFAVAMYTYGSTIEPTASFWDCG